MIIVTGGAGFIGANLVSKINQKGNLLKLIPSTGNVTTVLKGEAKSK